MKAKDYQKLLSEAVSEFDTKGVDKLIDLVKATGKAGGTIFAFGNGGSGSNASHFVQDLLKCPIADFKKAEGRYKTLCLSDNTAVLMAYANDLSYEEVFRQPLMNFCKKGDLVIGLSGSGNSMNVVHALEWARGHGAETFAIVGFSGGKAKKAAKHSIHIEKDNMQVYEDMAMMSLHAVIAALKPNA